MTIKHIALILTIFSVFYACQQKEDLEAKKEKLNNLKKEQHELKTKIDALEEEISKLDPEFAKINRKAALITTVPVKKGKFEHRVEVSGSVRSKKNVTLSAENPGNIISVLVSEGDNVKKGQLIASQDTQVLQKQLGQLETQYDLAKEMFKKQSNLWDQKIGTEVQYLEAKNRKESLEQQIANVKAQIAKSSIRAPFNGSIEQVYVNDGEMAMPGTQIAQIVNHSGLYVSADVSESYVGAFAQGDTVIIDFPSLNESIKARITAVGQVIDPQNRTFKVEIRLPKIDFKVKPNLLAVVKITDFEKHDASIVPSNLIQQDLTGEYVFITSKNSDQLVAKKVHIERGKTYKNETLVLSGLTGNEQLIDDGFKEVIDGSPVKVVENVL